MSDNTHYFAANVNDHAELKCLLESERISAIIDLCEYDWLNRAKWDNLPMEKRWLIIDTRSENWDKLADLIDRLFEIWDYEGQFWAFTVSLNGRVTIGTFYAEHLDKKSTVFSSEELNSLSQFFNKERIIFEKYLHYDYISEFCEAVDIPFFEMLDQDRGRTQLENQYPNGYVLYSHEMENRLIK